MPYISPSQHDLLAKAIGDRFSFSDLDIILFKCMGDRRIHHIANVLLPRWETARECLNETERTGDTVAFLALLVDARRSDEPFRILILKAVPQVADALKDTKALIREAVDQLYQTRNLLDDPEVKAAIAKSRGTIQDVCTSVGVLDAYKNLHDSLHNIQIHRLSGLHAAVRRMQTDPLQLDRLRDFNEVVRIAHDMAEPWVRKLAGVPQETEQSWVQKLGQTGGALQDALDRGDASEARTALNVILRILEVQPPRINELIVATAKRLPLQALETDLENVDTATGNLGDLKRTAASLRNLRASLLSRVVGHQLWQDADERLWVTDRLFFSPTGDIIDEFGMDWSPARGLVKALADSEPEAGWSKKALQYAAAVDDLTIRLDALTADGGVATLDKEQIQSLHRRYDDFRREARHRFFQVDKLLKENCAEFAAISTPLQSILGALDSQ